MFFDTHCHLNFKAFDGRVDEVVNNAKKAEVNNIIVPGTDVLTSQKAVEIASSCHPERSRGIYAAVGIHPHHIYEFLSDPVSNSFPSVLASTARRRDPFLLATRQKLDLIIDLLENPKVVAVGEVGMDKHIYKKTVYNVHKVHKVYKVDEEFIELQKQLFIEQIKLAYKYKKALIIHNREAKKEVLEILTNHQSLITNHYSVFHCCEPDDELLDFAKKNNIFIGVDGDITYQKDKQKFIKKVPLDLLVLETDSPFLMPRFLSMQRSWIRYNEPKNIPLIAGFIAQLLHCSIDELARQTTENAKKLFSINN